MKKTIIFDFDGTIADTLFTAGTILTDLSTKYGYKVLSEEEREKMRDYTIQEIFKKSEVPLYKLPLMVHDVKKELNKYIADLKVIKGMGEVVHQLKKDGYQLALVTSNNKANVALFLEKNKLDFFDIIYTGTTLFGKARVIDGLLKKYKLDKKEVVYVGDEIRDIEATKKVGIPIIAGSWGFNSRKGLGKFNPEFIIDKPEELLKILHKLQ